MITDVYGGGGGWCSRWRPGPPRAGGWRSGGGDGGRFGAEAARCDEMWRQKWLLLSHRRHCRQRRRRRRCPPLCQPEMLAVVGVFAQSGSLQCAQFERIACTNWRNQWSAPARWLLLVLSSDLSCLALLVLLLPLAGRHSRNQIHDVLRAQLVGVIRAKDVYHVMSN